MSLVVSAFKNSGERSLAKGYRPVSYLSVFSKFSEKLVNSRLVDHLEKCSFFCNFKYHFWSSQLTVDLLAVASDRITRTFNRSRATRGVAIDISKASDRD